LEKGFHDELEILSSLRCLKHPNIINLITAYTKGTTHNFILPVADGDLQDLLFPKNRIPDTKININEILRSLWGLSSAIEAIHEYSAEEFQAHRIGCHYDIKPGNILRKNGQLILSDFGLSSLRQVSDGSRSFFKKGEGAYIAPECEPSENDFNPGKIGRSSDIWSFGCVLAEILAYVSAEDGNGPASVMQFRKDRKITLGPLTGYHFYGEKDVNPKVEEFLDKILAEASPYGKDFKSLAFIVRGMLQFDPDNRPKARTVTRTLFHLAQQNIFCEIDTIFTSRTPLLDLDLQIELLRLKIWGDTVGLTAEPSEMLETACATKSYSNRDYQIIDGVLHQCFREVTCITEQLGSEIIPFYHLSYRLRALEDNLWDMQPEHIRKNMTDRLEAEMMDKIDTQNLQEALISINTDSSIELEGPRKKRFDSRRVAYLASMRDIAKALLQRDSCDQQFAVEKTAFVSPVTELGHHIVKTVAGTDQRVLIENIAYDDAWMDRTDELIARVNAIVSLRSRDIIKEAFPVLRCMGYYHDASRFKFGIVYELPLSSASTEPMNLVQIINKTQSRNKQPSLNTKFDLASLLVSHVLSFHRGGWVHKNISSFNVIFLPKDIKGVAKSLSSPYFVGFNHARQSDESIYSVLPSAEVMDYQHPTYLRNMKRTDDPVETVKRFRQEFDYYSVGLMLMEIAIWKTLQDITKSAQGSPEDFQKYLLETRVPLVKTYMGDRYGNAIKYCLNCYQGDNITPDSVREDFSRNVVLPISECSL
jgi:hypothetical protein